MPSTELNGQSFRFLTNPKPQRYFYVALADTTAPIVTSGNAFSFSENSPGSITLTANESATFAKVGGTDQTLFTLSGATLTLTAKNFESPVDANSDNLYLVAIQATDGSGNASAIQTISVTITNIFEQPTLAALSLSQSSFTSGTSASGSIANATTGSTITATNLPTGFTINSVARTWAYDGTPTSQTDITLIETLADSPNSGRSSTITLTFAGNLSGGLNANLDGSTVTAGGTLSSTGITGTETSTLDGATTITASMLSGYTVNALLEDAGDGTSAGRLIVDGAGTLPGGHTVAWVRTNPDGSFSSFLNDAADCFNLASDGTFTVIGGTLNNRGGTSVTPKARITRAADSAVVDIDLSIPITDVSNNTSSTETSPSTQPRDRSLTFYGDSIMAFSTAGVTLNQNVARAMNGRMAYSQNWVDYPQGGLSMLSIATQVENNIANDAGWTGIVLAGANGYANAGNTSDPQYTLSPSQAQVEAVGKRIVAAAVAAGKRMLFLTPLQSPNDDGYTTMAGGRQYLLNWLVSNPTEIQNSAGLVRVVDCRIYDKTIHSGTPGTTNTHPNYAGACLLSNLINRSMLQSPTFCDTNPYPLPMDASSGGAVANPLMAGTTGAPSTGTTGQVADNWTVSRTAGTAAITASKTTLIGQTAQRVSCSGAATIRLRLSVPINAVEKTAYEAACRIRVTGQPLGVWIPATAAWGASVPNQSNATDGIDQQVRILRTVKQVMAAGASVSNANLDILVQFGASGGTLDVSQVYAGAVKGSSAASSNGQVYDSTGAPVSISTIAASSDADVLAGTSGKVIIRPGVAVVDESSYVIGIGGAVTQTLGGATLSGTGDVTGATGLSGQTTTTLDGATLAATGTIVATPTTWNNTVNFGGATPQLQYSSDSSIVGSTAAMSGIRYTRGLHPRQSGKYYFEVLTSSTIAANRVGVGRNTVGGSATGTNGVDIAHYSGSTAFYSNGTNNGAASSSMGTAIALSDVIGVAVDLDAKLIWFRRNNGTWNNSGTANPATGAGGFNIGGVAQVNADVFPVVGLPNSTAAGVDPTNSNAAKLKAASGDWSYSSPSGFSAWTS